jgi:type I restriction enzyme R subunit
LAVPDRLTALIRDFTVFGDDGSGSVIKKMAGYHQFHAVQAAVEETLRAAVLQQSDNESADERTGHGSPRRSGGKPGDRRVGVVWHT